MTVDCVRNIDWGLPEDLDQGHVVERILKIVVEHHWDGDDFACNYESGCDFPHGDWCHVLPRKLAGRALERCDSDEEYDYRLYCGGLRFYAVESGPKDYQTLPCWRVEDLDGNVLGYLG